MGMRRILNYTAQKMRCICENATMRALNGGGGGVRGICWPNRAAAHTEYAQAAIKL